MRKVFSFTNRRFVKFKFDNTCPKSINHIEADAEKCSCGWRNLLRKYGFI